jgi:inosine-uridine nucleoside N-ribohydrolase
MTCPRVPVCFDMETGDPDDVLTLCLFATHPRALLLSVTVTPGSPEQVGLVRHVLRRLGAVGVPVGARSVGHPKRAVSEFHDRWLGPWPSSDPDGDGPTVLLAAAAARPDAVLVTGASLRNPGEALVRADAESAPFFLSWFCQGGFAGDSVVPPEHRLPKFAGLETCPTFNLNGDPRSALRLTASERILVKRFVSKNVCHGVVWDRAMHGRMTPFRGSNAGFDMVLDGMSKYLERRPEGKALHDPLAAMSALDPSVCGWAPVELYRERGEWGSRPSSEPGSAAISITVDRERFERVLAGTDRL